MATHLWLITAKTNLHVGNENTSGAGIIDKAVQRDVLTDLPCINSSSLKGAINEYCTHKGMEPEDRKRIFGSDKEKGGESRKGSAVFFDAKLLYLPLQCDDVPYRLATREEAVYDIISRAECLGIEGLSLEKLNEAVNSRYGYKTLNCQDFSTLCDNEHLPVIARNKLDNGTSETLWYEQVVPSETVFCAMTREDKNDVLAEFIDGKYIQIGANATIGYGVCHFNKVI